MDDNTKAKYGKASSVGDTKTSASELAGEVGRLLIALGWRLGVTESATGGLISQFITAVPGCSKYFLGGVIAYDNRVKTDLLKVTPETLTAFGAVSAQVAEEMAAGCLRLLKADICISDTGLAGPGGGTMEKPVGLFYLGLAEGDQVFSRRHVFKDNRIQNRLQAAIVALAWLRDYLAAR